MSPVISVLFGKYSRTIPLVFSLVPRSHGYPANLGPCGAAGSGDHLLIAVRPAPQVADCFFVLADFGGDCLECLAHLIELDYETGQAM